MNDLLQIPVKAHGDLERWKKVKEMRMAAFITGAIWFVKGQGDFLKDDVDGIIVPTQRRIYAYNGDYQPALKPLLVKIDMAEIILSY